MYSNSFNFSDFKNALEEIERPTDFSWCGPKPWVSLALEDRWKTKKTEVSNVCLRECGGGGDCMFYAISAAMHIGFPRDSTVFPYEQDDKERMQTARDWFAKSINESNVD